MPFSIDPRKKIGAEIQRIARERIDDALEGFRLATASKDAAAWDRAIHDARRRCKEIRALLRLIRGAIPPDLFEEENCCFREAAAGLSEARDAAVCVETFDKVCALSSHPRKGFSALREILHQRRLRVALPEQGTLEEEVRCFRERMRIAKARVKRWLPRGEGFEALSEGWIRTYRQGRKAMKNAYRHPTPENFHEWRKRVKDHRDHCRLLREIWPSVMKVRARELDTLAEALGYEHDLTMLYATLEDARGRGEIASSLKKDLDAFLTLISQEVERIRTEAYRDGLRLYAESPKAILRRIALYWEATVQKRKRWRNGITSPTPPPV